MGDESPGQSEVVCTACGESFQNERANEEPFGEVECPSCGERVILTGATSPPGGESRPGDHGFKRSEAPTERVDAPGAEGEPTEVLAEAEDSTDEHSEEEAIFEDNVETAKVSPFDADEGSEGGGEENVDGHEAGAEEMPEKTVEAGLAEISEGEFNSMEELREASSTSDEDADDSHEGSTSSEEEERHFEGEDTSKDQDSLERARKKSAEWKAQSEEESEGDADSLLEEMSYSQFESAEEERDDDSSPDFEGSSRDEQLAEEERPEFHGPDVGTPEQGRGFDDEALQERETAVKKSLSERSDLEAALQNGDIDGLEGDEGEEAASQADLGDPQKTPAVGMDKIAENISEVLAEEDDPNNIGRREEGGEQEGMGEESREDEPATTPSSGLEKAMEKRVDAELGENTEAAIDDAIRESFERGDDEEAEESLGEESSIPSPDEVAADEDEENESGSPVPPDLPPLPNTGSAGSKPKTPDAGSEKRSNSPLEVEPAAVEFPEDESDVGAPKEEASPPTAEDLLTEDEDSEPGVESVETGATEKDVPAEAEGDDRSPKSDEAAGGEETRDSESDSGRENPSASGKRAKPDAGATAETAAATSSGGDGGGLSRSLAIVFPAVVLVAAVVAVLFNPGGLLPESVVLISSNTSEAGPSFEFTSGEDESASRAVKEARSALYGAMEFDPSDAEVQKASAERLVKQERFVPASRVFGLLWEERRDDAEFTKDYLDVLGRAGRHARLREVALEAHQEHGSSAGFGEKYRASLKDDPELQSNEMTSIDELEGVDVIRRAEEVDFDGFVLVGLDGQPRYLFEPAESDARRWRDDIAAWRLCQILVCGFEIPRTRPARISRSSFKKRLKGESTESVLSELHWVEEKGLDGEKRPFVHGALRDWPGDLTRWPIEKTGLWRDWLSVHSEEDLLDQPLEESLSGLENFGDGSLYEALTSGSDEASTRSMAAGLSRVISFDFLTNNWERFAEPESAYGSQNHYADGRFVTIHTETVFQRRDSTRVKGRFRWMSRFSRDFVDSARLLDSEEDAELLYPEPSGLERAKLEVFWDQHDAFLARVDDLIESHGRDSVLTFE